jgi:hypothetical protein
VNNREAQGLIAAARIYLGRYKGANSALKEAKSALEEFMDAEGVNNVDGDEPGSGARFVYRQNRQLLLDQMTDELVVWCARNGVLTGAVGKFDELPGETRTALADFVGQGEGTRYVDIYFPSWQSQQQAKKETARAANTATRPPAPPQLVAAPTPLRKAQERPPEQAQQPVQDTGVLACPDHPNRKAKVSQYNGGLYCTARIQDGYCKWTSEAKAS